MTDTLITAFSTLGVGVLGVLGGWAAKRAPTVGSREMALVDQLQELVDEHKQTNAEMRTALEDSQRRERALLDYSYALRRHIEDELGPPAPAWPEGLN